MFAVLIFEINTYVTDPLVEVRIGKGFRLGQKERLVQASIWLHVVEDERWKENIPIDLEKSCLKLCGPVDWKLADELIRKTKVLFDQLGIENFELTCSDD